MALGTEETLLVPRAVRQSHHKPEERDIIIKTDIVTLSHLMSLEIEKAAHMTNTIVTL